MHKRLFSIILLSVFTITTRLVYAQQPVQVNTLLRPPYTLQLSDYYATTQEKLILILTNRDLNKPILNVRLRMTIESQTVQLRSRDFASLPILQLEAGVPLRLSLRDLAPYFNTENLDFSGITRAQYAQQAQLPEGFYQFCFEAIEVSTGLVASTKNCAMAWISLSDPPLLNIPAKDETIAQKEPQNIIFQWTPRHLNSPNSAFATEYDFQLVELWDNTLAPEVAFQSMQPLYEVTTRTTTLLYGPSQPQLIVGKRYGWRVQARAKSGVEDVDVFRNQGFSEIYWFTYKEMCPLPAGINATIGTFGNIQLSWTPAAKHIGYKVMYRQKDKANATWFDQQSSSPLALIYDVQPGVAYEYQVGAYCSTDQLAVSEVYRIKIPPRTSEDFANCSIVPDPTITNKQILQQLKAGDVITAGDFPVKISQIFGSGRFSGKGYVTVPFLGRAKVKVNFWNIQVNTTNQLIAGKIITTYDVSEGSIVDADEAVDIFRDYQGIVSRLQGFAADVDRDDLMNVLDKLIDKAEKELPPAAVDEIKKNVAELLEVKNTYDQIKATYDAISDGDPLKTSLKKDLDEAAQKFDEIKSRFEGKDKHAVTSEKYNIVFGRQESEPYQTKYGFDSLKYIELKFDYEAVERGGETYSIPWKSVAQNEYDWVKVEPRKKGDLLPEKMEFRTTYGTLSFNKESDAVAYLKVHGNGEKDEVIAYEKREVNGKNVNVEIGRLNIVSYPQVYRKLVLVLLNGTPLPYSLQEIQKSINRIYNQVAVQWSVEVRTFSSDYDKNKNGLEIINDEMKTIINDYINKEKIVPGTSYMFLEQNIFESDTGFKWGGFSDFNSPFGFIVVAPNQSLHGYLGTLAHELGHGAFGLQHTFNAEGDPTELNIPKGTTDNIMDYSDPEGAYFYKFQWDRIHYPTAGFSFFDTPNNIIIAKAMASIESTYSEAELTRLQQDVDTKKKVLVDFDNELIQGITSKATGPLVQENDSLSAYMIQEEAITPGTDRFSMLSIDYKTAEEQLNIAKVANVLAVSVRDNDPEVYAILSALTVEGKSLTDYIDQQKNTKEEDLIRDVKDRILKFIKTEIAEMYE